MWSQVVVTLLRATSLQMSDVKWRLSFTVRKKSAKIVHCHWGSRPCLYPFIRVHICSYECWWYAFLGYYYKPFLENVVQKAHFKETAVVTRFNLCTFLRVLNECMMKDLHSFILVFSDGGIDWFNVTIVFRHSVLYCLPLQLLFLFKCCLY